MTRIESGMEKLDDRLRSVEISAARVEAKLDAVGGQLSTLASKLPSWWQMPVVMAGTVVFLIALVTAAVAVGRYLGLIAR